MRYITFRDWTAPRAPYGSRKNELWLADDYDRYFNKQNGLCALCHQPLNAIRRLNHLDHDHATGRKRGLVHQACNHALGGVDKVIALIGIAALLDYVKGCSDAYPTPQAPPNK